jgi:phosphatidylinositol-3-phosphatase
VKLRLVVGMALAVLLFAATAGGATTPAIGHVFVIVLENEGYASSFGTPSADPYLAQTLPSQGALLTHYYGIGHESNPNYIAMVSGQGPNPETQADCQLYDDFVGTGPTTLSDQAVGAGCVYPQQVQTIGNQLTENGLTWKGYLEDMGNVPSREAAACGHPALNSRDGTQTAVPGDGYATRHDPFVYFHAVIDDTAYCAAHVVPLTGLASDLKTTARTPQLSFVVPDLCDDGHDFPCTNEPSPGASALADTDAFLKTWVPRITGSSAFKKDGLLVITFDEAGQDDSSACCGHTVGGGRVGAVLLSPRIRPRTVSDVPYDHYALLASLETFFGLPRLGYASTAPTFGPDVFNR